MDLSMLTTVIGGYSDHMHGDGSGWMWLTGLVAMFVMLAAVVVAVALFTRGDRVGRGTGPREILAERYARGELSTDEYHERLDGLR